MHHEKQCLWAYGDNQGRDQPVNHSSWRNVFFNRKVLIFFLFLHENICCGYSLEVPQRGTSNEYPQHMFSWRNKKKKYHCCLVDQYHTYQLTFDLWSPDRDTSNECQNYMFSLRNKKNNCLVLTLTWSWEWHWISLLWSTKSCFTVMFIHTVMWHCISLVASAQGGLWTDASGHIC